MTLTDTLFEVALAVLEQRALVRVLDVERVRVGVLEHCRTAA